MGRVFKNTYQTVLKHLVKLTDDIKQSSSYIENQHERTNKDKNLISTDLEAIKKQLTQPEDVNQILRNLHEELIDNQEDLKKDGLNINSFTNSIQIYWDIFTQGYESGASRTGILETKNLPNIVDFLKVFDWLNKVMQVSNKLSHETKDPMLETKYIDVEEEAQSALREFRRYVLPFTEAFQEGFINIARKELTIASKETTEKYHALNRALKEKSWLLKELGLKVTTQRKLKSAINPKYVQSRFFNHSIEAVFTSIDKTLDEFSLQDARKKIIPVLANFQKRSKNSKKELALALSYQLTKDGLTIPQKIIRLTNEPAEQEHALGILLALKDFNVKFDGRCKKLNTCLHALKTWHQTLAQFLTLIDDSSSKTAVNSNNQTPVEVLEQKFYSNDPYYNSDSFVAIQSLLSPKSLDFRKIPGIA